MAQVAGPEAEMIERIASALSAGTPIAEACLYAKITPIQYQEWRERGAKYGERLAATADSFDGETIDALAESDEEQPYLDFFRRTEEARAALAVHCTTSISKAARAGEWRAAAWLLERTNPEQFGRKIIQHVGAGGGVIQLDVTVVEQNLANSVAQFVKNLGASGELDAGDDLAEDDVADAELVDED